MTLSSGMQKRLIHLLILLLTLIFGSAAPAWAGPAGPGSQEAGQRPEVISSSSLHLFVNKSLKQVGLVEVSSENVLADNPDNHGGVRSCKVEAVIDGNSYEFFEIGLDTNGDGLADGNSVKSTPLHPFFTRRGWIYARDLKIGDEIKTDKGLYYPVRKHDKLTGYSSCYNLSVANEHCYYVKVASEAVLVHNAMRIDSGSSGSGGSTHKNCNNSTAINHVYRIYSTSSFYAPPLASNYSSWSRNPLSKIFKYGISAQGKKSGGTVSIRADDQVRDLNRTSPGDWRPIKAVFTSQILQDNLSRMEALALEQALVNAYAMAFSSVFSMYDYEDSAPQGNKRPYPKDE
jgi:Pretoxin HINT domain